MKSKLTFLFSFFLLLLLPTALIFAATTPAFKPLVGIPGLTDASPNFNTYINTLYSLSISIAALLAVIKIIIAGMKYMLSDVVTTKGDAIKDIRGALLGLLIVVSAVLILRVINPQLTKTTIFFDPVTNQTSSFTGNTSGTNRSGGPLPYRREDLDTLSQTIRKNAGSETVIDVGTGSEQEWQNMRNTCVTDLPGGIVIKETRGGKQVYVCKKIGLSQTIKGNTGTEVNTSPEIITDVKTGTEQEWQNMRTECILKTPGGIVFKEIRDGKQVYVCKKI